LVSKTSPIDHHDPQVRRLGHDLMRQVRRMFDIWRRYKLNKISWDEFQRDMSPHSAESRQPVTTRSVQRQPAPGRHVSGTLQPSRMAVDVRGCSRRGTDQQHCGTSPTPSGDLSEALVWDTECVRQPIHRADADGQRDMPSPGPFHFRLPDGRVRSPLPTSNRPLPPTRHISHSHAGCAGRSTFGANAGFTPRPPRGVNDYGCANWVMVPAELIHR
jgi:hypothetical protein